MRKLPWPAREGNECGGATGGRVGLIPLRGVGCVCTFTIIVCQILKSHIQIFSIVWPYSRCLGVVQNEWENEILIYKAHS